MPSTVSHSSPPPATNGIHANRNPPHALTSTNGRETAANGITSSLTDIPTCIETFSRGSFLIVLDSPSRENEGDLIISAAHLTTSKAAFLIRHTSGYLCAPMSAERAALLDLQPMVSLKDNADKNRTNYTITVDAISGFADGTGAPILRGQKGGANGLSPGEAEAVTTGISAHDRAVTCRVLGDSRATAGDLRRPGHVVPLIARKGGVRERSGHTEAGWELCRLAGLTPEVAVIGEMVIDGEEADESPAEDGVDGEDKAMNGHVNGHSSRRRNPEYFGSGMMRAKECIEFGRKWGIPVCTIEDLEAYVVEREGPFEL